MAGNDEIDRVLEDDMGYGNNDSDNLASRNLTTSIDNDLIDYEPDVDVTRALG